MGTIVDKLYGEYSAIVSMMDQYNAVSFRNTLNENFRKTLLLSAASHFEHRITTDVVAFCAEVAGGNTMIQTLVRNKAVSRQYHTWFQWEANNANAFFNMFGEDFRSHMIGVVRGDQNVAKSIAAFLEIGRERNRLVHQDYGSFFLEKTAEEIFGLYVSAMVFVEFVPKALRDFSARLNSKAAV
jgi:hypothetical protein